MRFAAVIAVGDDEWAGAAAADLAARADIPLLACDAVDTAELAGDAGQLVVIGTHRGGRRRGPLHDAAAEDVLQRARSPVLVVGPQGGPPSPRATVLLPVDATADVDATIAAAERWAGTFGAARTEVIGLTAPDPWPDDDGPPSDDRPTAVAVALRGHSLAATVRRMSTPDPAATLADLAATSDRGLLIVAATRWPDDRSHWYGTVRDLIRRAAGPVVVVPTDGR